MFARFKNSQLVVIILIMLISSLKAQDPFTYDPTQYGFDHTNGIGWADFNDDGYLDFYFSDGNVNWPSNNNHLFINNGDNTFSEQIASPLSSDDFVSGGLTIGDFDNDNDLDIFVAEVFRVASSFPNDYKTIYALYENEGFGFTRPDNYGDLSTQTTQCGATAAWGDYNNDGFLDLAVSTQYIKFGPTKNLNAMFLNNQDGTFTKVSNNVTANETHQGGVAWADYDADGDIDLVTVAGREYQNTTLWVNTGSDFTGTTLLTGEDAKGASWGDYDNDGDLDLFIAISGVNLDAGSVAQDNVLFRNDAGILTPVEVGELTTDLLYSMASAWGDYDNDGDLDIFVGNAGGDTSPQLSYIYVNNAGTFTKLTNTILSDSSTYTQSAAWGDMDNDGDLDLLAGRSGKNRIFENVLNNGNHWINIKLIGVDANKDGIGSLVRVKATIGGEPTWLLRDISAQTGFGGQNSLRAHFGLGNATMVDSIVVDWAGSGSHDVFTNVPVDQFLQLTEHQVSALKDKSLASPTGFVLAQNFPNPFNPSTTIRYQLARAGQVTLTVFNAKGQALRTLVNANQSAGEYRVLFRADDFASGIYFYKLSAGPFVEIKKMILMQ